MIKNALFNYLNHKKNLNIALTTVPGKQYLDLIDIGAAGGLEPRWKAIEKHIFYIGFEPDKRSNKEIEEKLNKVKHKVIHPVPLWSSNKLITFNLCRRPEVSSAFHPNDIFLSKFPNSSRFEVISKDSLDCVQLDNLNIDNCDFMKLDIQGGELEVLLGSKKILPNTLGIEVEVEFSPLYINQPLFGDINTFLSSHNFEFMDFTNITRWERKRLSGIGQAVFGDALFMKSPEYVLEKLNNLDSISAYLKISLLYRRFDLIEIVLNGLPIEQRVLFKEFETNIRVIEKNLGRARKISKFTDKLLRLCGIPYRSHLIY